jgi:hypothetical protein
VLYARRMYQRGKVLFPDDSGVMASPDFGVGTSGIAAFLHRLVSGTPRIFMVDECLDVNHAMATTASRRGELWPSN